jgi:hypothetical protein
MPLVYRLPSSVSTIPCHLLFTASYVRRGQVTAGRCYNTSATSSSADLPLEGVRVLELGQLIAGLFAGQLLGYDFWKQPTSIFNLILFIFGLIFVGMFYSHFGAEVVKVEPPKVGDPLRIWRELDIDGTSPWFRSSGRNKKCVTIDMRQEKGRQLSPTSPIHIFLISSSFGEQIGKEARRQE